MESRIEILDRLSVRFGKEFDIKNFNEFLIMYNKDAIILLVRKAMAEYANQIFINDKHKNVSK